MPTRNAWLWASVAAVVFGVAAVYGGGSVLLHPARTSVGPLPDGVAGATVSLASRSGAALAAWEVPGACGCGAVVVLHGVRANRAAVANRVALFHHAGYAVVAADLQAHGESEGDQITYGYLERYDAAAAVAYARSRFPEQPVAVVGVSLGGAAAVLAGSALGADAVVLEAVYADIESATRNRLRRRGGALAEALAPALLAQLPLRTPMRAASLRPVDAIGGLGAPVLVVAGTVDEHTTPADTERLYTAARSPKELWWVEGAAHVDFLNYAPDEYRSRVVGFLDTHLAATQSVPGQPPAR